MREERPRAARYPFMTDVTLTDLELDENTIQKTLDLSLFGCRLVTENSLSTGNGAESQNDAQG